MTSENDYQQLDQIIQDFFTEEILKLLEILARPPKRTGRYASLIIMDAEQSAASLELMNQMTHYAKEYLESEKETDLTDREIALAINEEFRRRKRDYRRKLRESKHHRKDAED